MSERYPLGELRMEKGTEGGDLSVGAGPNDMFLRMRLDVEEMREPDREVSNDFV